jgi:hypothetical protein
MGDSAVQCLVAQLVAFNSVRYQIIQTVCVCVCVCVCVSLAQAFYLKYANVLQLSSATCFGHYGTFPRIGIGMFELSLILDMQFVARLQLNTCQLCVLLFSWVFKMC